MTFKSFPFSRKSGAVQLKLTGPVTAQLLKTTFDTLFPVAALLATDEATLEELLDTTLEAALEELLDTTLDAALEELLDTTLDAALEELLDAALDATLEEPLDATLDIAFAELVDTAAEDTDEEVALGTEDVFKDDTDEKVAGFDDVLLLAAEEDTRLASGADAVCTKNDFTTDQLPESSPALIPYK